MYRVIRTKAKPLLGSLPVAMPLRALLAPMRSPFPDLNKLFNLPGAAARLLGQFGWERASQVLLPQVWAPDWPDGSLEMLFNSSPFFPGWTPPLPRMDEIRAPDMPGTGRLATPDASPYPRYDIVHYIGRVEPAGPGDDPVLKLDALDQALHMGSLRDSLIASQTRLLILQMEDLTLHPFARRMADFLVRGGVPAVLCASFGAGQNFQEYMAGLYAEIVHNKKLPEAAQPPAWQPLPEPCSIDLYLGTGADSILQYTGLMDNLETQLRTDINRLKTREVRKQPILLKASHKKMQLYMHQSQNQKIWLGLSEVGSLSMAIPPGLEENLSRLGDVRNMTWDHETQGAVPLADVVEEAEKLGGATERYHALVGELAADLDEAARKAPRVLNANFGRAATGKLLKPDEAMVEDEDYDLLVDIGPRWNRIKSLVSGHAEFPDRALPPDKDGYDLHVVLVSEDLTPNMVDAWMWLPRSTGRSFPASLSPTVAEGRPLKEEKPGPVALRVRTPSTGTTPESDASRSVRGRLCIYYENNLLQSAVVRMGLQSRANRKAGARLEKPNEINVDYVLSGSLQDIDRFSRRAVSFVTPDESPHPVALNLTLNDDGGGGHRLLVRKQGQLPPAWMPYDPLNGKTLLDNARQQLLSCFCKRSEDFGTLILDANGDIEPGLDPSNGKGLKPFMWDLMNLAQLGARLFNQLFQSVRPGQPNQTNAEWVAELRQTLADSRVIQVSRTTPANYVFPWALIYDYPLPGPTTAQLRFCSVVQEEWDDKGVRANQVTATRCKYHDEEWHKNNILCPYGFWGLKHIIEQPTSPVSTLTDPNPLKDVPPYIDAGDTLELSVASTQDATLDAQLIKTHLSDLGMIARLKYAPPPANDWNTVCSLLSQPEIFYFLCHGEYDAALSDAYLGVGARDADPFHRIYSNNLSQWLQTLSPDVWKKRRPLIFINGCHTANLEPGQVLNFVSAFAAAGASGVIGTEVSIRLPLAVEVAEGLLKRLADCVPVGTALREIRWDLANKGNLLGLAYTPYCLADLAVQYTN